MILLKELAEKSVSLKLKMRNSIFEAIMLQSINKEIQ